MDKSEITPYQETILGKKPQGEHKVISKYKTESYSVGGRHTYHFQFSNSPKPNKLYIFTSEKVIANYKPLEGRTAEDEAKMYTKKRHTYKSNIIDGLHIRGVGIADNNLEDYQYFIKNQM